MGKTKQEYRYRQVMDVIVSMLQNEILKPGDKVPSLRKMSDEQSVSVSTVMQAYMELEEVGMLEARPQSGFYVSRGTAVPREHVSRTKPHAQPTQASKSDHIQMILESVRDPEIVPLGCAIPSYDLLPHKDLINIMKKILNMDGWVQVEYGDTKGERFFRQQVAHYMNMNGNSVGYEDLIVTNGASEGMALALRALTRPGDLILMESPSYFGFMHLLETSKVFALELPTCPQEGISLSEFHSAVKKYDVKAFLCQPNNGNPMSHSYPDEVREEIVKICNKHDIPIIEDDINGDFTYSGKRGYNMKRFDKNGNVIYISSFTKTLAPGFRVGWVEPGKYYDEIFRQKIANTMATNEVPQMALAHYLASGKYPRHLKRMRNTLKSQVETYGMNILKHFPQGTKITNPKGGFVLWAELPEQVDTMHMYEIAMQEKISFSPGGMFTTQEKYNNCLRLNCGYPYDDRMDKALKKLGNLATSY